MRLNSFLWNSFLESERGQGWVDFFSRLEAQYKASDQALLRFVDGWSTQGLRAGFGSTGKEIDGVLRALLELRQAIKEGHLAPGIGSKEEAEAYFHVIGDELAPDDDEEENLFELDDIPHLSIALYCLHPKFFFPYYFYPNFLALQKVFQEFGIFLPPVPPKKDEVARFYYYLELCGSLYAFWENLGFAPEHLPAFLYGFAPEVLDLSFPDLRELQKPHNAWLVAGGTDNGDADYLDKADACTQTFWTGNKETEVGDIIVMYCLAPRSAIHSIWQATRPGGIEPFRGYYSTVWMGYPHVVPALSLKTMKSDPVLSKWSVLKGMQSISNNVKIPKIFYDRIVLLLEENGTNVSKLPKLENRAMESVSVESERDVEIHVLEPLLRALGFDASDWERQVHLRVGRSEKVIPDYLIRPERDQCGKFVHAEWVWEAKLSILSHSQLEKDFQQVCSYARLVDARGASLLSKEGVWVGLKMEGFSLKVARHWPANQLGDLGALNEIRAIAGKSRLRRRD
jgi:hypothetical protein